MTEEEQFSPARAVARLEIQHRIYQFCRGVDRLDLELARGAFHDDAIDDHGRYVGNVDGLLAWVRERHAALTFSYHHIGNIFIEFSGPDDAFVESYIFLWQSFTPTGPDGSRGDEKQVAARYVDHFTRRDGRWRIQRRVTLAEAGSLVTPPTSEQAGGSSHPVARPRDERDPSQLLRRSLGLG